MNWIQKICQSKPMPVPFAPSIKEHYRGYKTIDEKMKEDTARFEEAKYDQLQYLDQGIGGIVYKRNPNEKGSGINKIQKYTSDRKEAEKAKEIYHNPIWCVVRVLEEPQLIQRNPDLWRLTTEEVQTLNKDERKLIFMYRLRLAGESLSKDEEEKLSLPSNQELLYKYRQLENCLKVNHFTKPDAHGGNLGYNTEGNLVLLDLGDPYKSKLP